MTVANGNIIDLSGQDFFNVATDKSSEIKVATFDEAMKKVRGQKNYGIWFNKKNGMYYVDVSSRVVGDPRTAVKLGTMANQETVMSWKNWEFPTPAALAKKSGLYDPDDVARMAGGTDEAINGIIDKEILAPRYYSEADKARFAALEQNQDFVSLAAETDNIFKRMYKAIDLGSSDIDEMGLPVAGSETTKFASTMDDKGIYRHATTEQFDDLKRKIRDARSDQMTVSEFRGNTNTFSGREYKMSAMEANLLATNHQKNLIASGTPAQKTFWTDNQNVKMFEETIQSSIDDFIDQSPRFAKNTKMMDTVLVHGWADDPNIIKRFDGDKVPFGYRKVSKSSLESKLNQMKKYVSPASEAAFDDVLKSLPDTNEILMESNVWDLVGRLDDTKSTNLLVNLLDMSNNAFKRFKLLSPGFQMRNMLGNYTNLYLAGMPIDDIAKGFAKADGVMKLGDELMEKIAKDPKAYDAFSDAQKEAYRVYSKFIRNDFHNAAEEVWDIPTGVRQANKEKENVLKEIQKFNSKMNTQADKRYRMAAMMYAEEHPEIYQKLGLDSDVAFVRHTLFDPKDLSAAEKDIGKRLVPFYTFTKKNLAFQMKNLIDNPVKYKRVKKAVQALWESRDIDPTQIEAYKRENFWLPLFKKKNGEYIALKANLPIGDLGEALENPLGKAVSSVAPIIRTPFELATNTQAYTGLPIQEFKGQKGYSFPELGRKSEYLLQQTGLDVPIQAVADPIRAIGGLAKGELTPADAATNAVGRSFLSTGSVEKAQTTKSYAELQALQDQLRFYKQEGVDILTIAEAENRNSALNAVSVALTRISK